jgi:serine/threonine-protein kinase
MNKVQREADNLRVGAARAVVIGAFAFLAFIVLDLFVRATLFPEASLGAIIGCRLGGAAVLGVTVIVFRRPGLTRHQVVSYAACLLPLAALSLAGLAILFGGLESAYVFTLAYFAVAGGTFLPSRWSEMTLIIAPTMAVFLGAIVLGVALSDDLRPQLDDPVAVSVFVVNALLILGLGAFAVLSGHIHWRSRQALDDARRLGRYRLQRLLGEGGMNQVWLARDDALARDIALKILRTNPGIEGAHESDNRRRRFEREAQATSALTSPHTVRVFDHGMNDDGVSWIAMEYLRGLDLDQLVARHGPLHPCRAVHLARQAAISLAEAHGLGLVHRDIKPANLFVLSTPDELDFLKVVDFGIARQLDSTQTTLTIVGMLIGTPAFMAPELFLGRPADARSDVYALGASLYVALTGELPVLLSDVRDLASVHARPVTPPSQRAPLAFDPAYRDELDGLVARCLSPDPGERPADGRALLSLIESLPVAPWTESDARRWWSEVETRETHGEREFATTPTAAAAPDFV